MKKLAVVAVVSLAAAGCGNGEQSDHPVSTTHTATTVAPADHTYGDAFELASDLTRHGVECDATDDITSAMRIKIAGEQSVAKCALPVEGDPEGVPITLSVWPTPVAKTTGLAAWSRFLRSARGDGPQVYYLLSGVNWVIDFSTQRKAPEQVMGVFGGKLEIVD